MMETIEKGSFCIGALCALVAALIVGFIGGQIREARLKQRADRPLDTFPDASQPDLTPARICREHQEAAASQLFWTIILIITVIAFLGGMLLFLVQE
jgi:hypothetical protein